MRQVIRPGAGEETIRFLRLSTGSKISWGNLLFLDLPKKVSDSSEVEDFVFLSFSPVGLHEVEVRHSASLLLFGVLINPSELEEENAEGRKTRGRRRPSGLRSPRVFDRVIRLFDQSER